MATSYKIYYNTYNYLWDNIFNSAWKRIDLKQKRLDVTFDSKEEQEEEKSNFDFNSKKCYPHMIPIAGFFEDAKGDDFISKTINNFNTCIFDKVEMFIKENAKPLMFIITFIKDGIKSIGVVLNAFRKFASF